MGTQPVINRPPHEQDLPRRCDTIEEDTSTIKGTGQPMCLNPRDQSRDMPTTRRADGETHELSASRIAKNLVCTITNVLGTSQCNSNLTGFVEGDVTAPILRSCSQDLDSPEKDLPFTAQQDVDTKLFQPEARTPKRRDPASSENNVPHNSALRTAREHLSGPEHGHPIHQVLPLSMFHNEPVRAAGASEFAHELYVITTGVQTLAQCFASQADAVVSLEARVLMLEDNLATIASRFGKMENNISDRLKVFSNQLVSTLSTMSTDVRDLKKTLHEIHQASSRCEPALISQIAHTYKEQSPENRRATGINPPAKAKSHQPESKLIPPQRLFMAQNIEYSPTAYVNHQGYLSSAVKVTPPESTVRRNESLRRKSMSAPTTTREQVMLVSGAGNYDPRTRQCSSRGRTSRFDRGHLKVTGVLRPRGSACTNAAIPNQIAGSHIMARERYQVSPVSMLHTPISRPDNRDDGAKTPVNSENLEKTVVLHHDELSSPLPKWGGVTAHGRVGTNPVRTASPPSSVTHSYRLQARSSGAYPEDVKKHAMAGVGVGNGDSTVIMVKNRRYRYDHTANDTMIAQDLLQQQITIPDEQLRFNSLSRLKKTVENTPLRAMSEEHKRLKELLQTSPNPRRGRSPHSTRSTNPYRYTSTACQPPNATPSRQDFGQRGNLSADKYSTRKYGTRSPLSSNINSVNAEPYVDSSHKVAHELNHNKPHLRSRCSVTGQGTTKQGSLQRLSLETAPLCKNEEYGHLDSIYYSVQSNERATSSARNESIKRAENHGDSAFYDHLSVDLRATRNGLAKLNIGLSGLSNEASRFRKEQVR